MRRWVAGLAILMAGHVMVQGVEGWLHWRGPQQNGTTLETGLPDDIDPAGGNLLWSKELAGRGAPVVADGRLYSFGYRGEGTELREYLTCFDAETGEQIWELGFSDFLSDIVYNRYAIGSPTVDSETGNIYLMTTVGVFVCVSPEGRIIWEHSMMERFGRLTFPNGRTGAPVIDRDLVIHHGITSFWGAQGPARDRFFAFDKKSGEIVWISTPGTAPKDSSFSSPVLGWSNGRRVLYAGTGCGNVVCINVRTGEPIWRFHLSYGGVNASLLLHDNDKIIAIHGKENLDKSEVGRMVAIRTGAQPEAGADTPQVLDGSYELWRNPLVMFTSSPVLVGDRVYQVTHTGELACVDANEGTLLWTHKLNNSQLHASPLYAEGKLYIPIVNGKFYILKLRDDGVDVLDEEQLQGGCLGAPVAWNGKLYVHTMEKLYCFGKAGNNPGLPKPLPEEAWPVAGPASQLQIIPADVLLAPGETQSFRVRSLDDKGFVAGELSAADLEWDAFIPPTARVRTSLDGAFDTQGRLQASAKALPSAGAFKAAANGLTGITRGRVLPAPPLREDLERFEIANAHPEGHMEAGAEFAYPPLPWIGARFKWEIRERDGGKVLRKTLDNVLFQRAITFIGDPNLKNYTLQADVMTDGNRRIKSNVGLINQRYFITLIGNAQLIEVSSNHDRLKVSERYSWKPKTWYTLKTRVDVQADGSGIVRAKVWPREEAEPAGWTFEVPHAVAHTQGAPGLFGFSPQSLFPVYVDNIVLTAN